MHYLGKPWNVTDKSDNRYKMFDKINTDVYAGEHQWNTHKDAMQTRSENQSQIISTPFKIIRQARTHKKTIQTHKQPYRKSQENNTQTYEHLFQNQKNNHNGE